MPKSNFAAAAIRACANGLGVRGREEMIMATYVLMTKLATRALTDERSRKAAARDWKRHVDRLCPNIKWIAHYSLLGRYDFMDIYEASDDEQAHTISLLSRHSGAVEAESWPAVRHDTYLKLVERVEAEIGRG